MVYQILQKLKNTKSLNERVQIVQDNLDDELFLKVLHYTLDPYRVFGIKQIPAHKPSVVGCGLSQVFNYLDKFANNEITGNRATETLNALLNNLNEEDGYVLQRIIDKDLKCGVGTKLVNDAIYKKWGKECPVDKYIPTFDPMAAYLYDVKRAKYPCYAEPKLDGMRCVYFVDEDADGKKAVCYSRGGKEIETLDLITKEILELYPVGYVIDGEIITPGSFEGAMSIIRRKKENAKEGEIFFNVFDVLTFDEWESQECKLTLKERKETRFHKEDSQFVKTVPYIIVNNEEEAFKFYEECIDKGFPYEGAMLKKIESPYEFKRSTNWLKIKPEETTDLEVIGYYEGEKNTKNEGRLGGFICDLGNGNTVRVGGGFSEKEPNNQRRIFWEQKDELIGQIIEVKFMEWTANNTSLRHPRFLKFRSYKNEKV